MPVPLKDSLVPKDQYPNMVVWYGLEASSIAINIAELKYVLLTDRVQEHYTCPLRHYCDVRSPVYPMAFSKLCVIALFMKDEKRIAKKL